MRHIKYSTSEDWEVPKRDFPKADLRAYSVAGAATRSKIKLFMYDFINITFFDFQALLNPIFQTLLLIDEGWFKYWVLIFP